jgi:hypothetical protein
MNLLLTPKDRLSCNWPAARNREYQFGVMNSKVSI